MPTTEPNQTCQQTRERLLDAAEKLFAAHGFAGTSVREITREAGCNLAAVNYHFGGKLGLYRELFRLRLAALREQRIASVDVTATSNGKPPSVEFVLTSFANAFLGPLVDTSRGRILFALMERELLDPQLPPDVFMAEMFGPVQSALGTAVATVEPDLPRDAVGPCIRSFIAQLIYIVQMQSLDRRLGRSAHTLADRVEHVVRFSAAGIRAYASGGTK